jgi:hypothetical protein
MPAKSKSKGFEDVASAIKSGKKVLKTVTKAAQLAKGAKGIYSRAKEAAGKSKCENKQCSWKEKLEDFAERAIRGGKSVYGEREKIKSMVEEGKRLVSGESVKKSKPMKMKKSEKSAAPAAPAPPPAAPAVKAPPAAPAVKAAPAAPAVKAAKSLPSRGLLIEDIKKGKDNLRKTSMSKPKNQGDMYGELYERIKSMRRSSKNDMKD